MRGVNRLVIEVHPENEYFEKALLFLRPDKQEIPQKNISDSADKLLCDIKYNRNNTKLNKRTYLFLIFIGIAAGSLISMLIFSAVSLMS